MNKIFLYKLENWKQTLYFDQTSLYLKNFTISESKNKKKHLINGINSLVNMDHIFFYQSSNGLLDLSNSLLNLNNSIFENSNSTNEYDYFLTSLIKISYNSANIYKIENCYFSGMMTYMNGSVIFFYFS